MLWVKCLGTVNLKIENFNLKFKHSKTHKLEFFFFNQINLYYYADYWKADGSNPKEMYYFFSTL